MAKARRRQFLIAAGALLAAPVAVRAQQTAGMRRIGYLTPFPLGNSLNVEAFRQGLREAGYVEGKNVIVEMRSAEGRQERLPQLLAELLDLKMEVIVAASTPGALAAKRATTTVPIVFGGVLDPVGSGIVATLARPGGNITGVTVGIGGAGFTGKCLELLKEAAPAVSHVAVLVNPTYPLSAQFRKEVPAAARSLALKFDLHEASKSGDLDAAFDAIGASGAQGIFVAPDPFLTDSSRRIAVLAASKRLPALHFSKRFAEAGGLMSYGGSLEDSYRRAAAYVDRILKGAKPADLPVEQPTRFELVINLGTAKAIGLKFPQSILLRADQVIE
jgi:putative ABC transport system substrate-binding protein